MRRRPQVVPEAGGEARERVGGGRKQPPGGERPDGGWDVGGGVGGGAPGRCQGVGGGINRGGGGGGGGSRRRRDGRSRPTAASVEASGRPAEAHEAPAEGGRHGSAPRTREGCNNEKRQTVEDVLGDDGEEGAAGGCRPPWAGRRAAARDRRGRPRITPARGRGGSSADDRATAEQPRPRPQRGLNHVTPIRAFRETSHAD